MFTTLRQNYRIILVLGLFSLLTGLSGSSINLALPQISIDLVISNSAATWIIQVGMITTVIVLVMFGHLGDLLSKTAIFTIGGYIFIAGSVLTGLAPNYWLILLGRFIQAIGSAMTLANSLGIVNQYATDQNRTELIAIIAMFMSVGSLSGPAFGGVVISQLSWRWLFLFNLPVGLIALWIGRHRFKIPKNLWPQTTQVARHLNWGGQLLFSVGIIAFFLSSYFAQGQHPNWPLTLLLLVGGLGVTVYSFYQDDHSLLAWIDPAIFRNKLYLVSVSILFLVMLVNAISDILLPFYLQSYGGLSALVSGLIMMLQASVMFFVTPLAGYIADRWDAAKLTTIGLVILSASQLGYAFYPATMNLALIIPTIIANGIGMSLFLSPNNALTMSSVPNPLAGVAGSLSSLARTLGMTAGISLATSLLFIQLPGVVRITPQVGRSFLTAYRRVFLLAMGISLLAFGIIAWRLWQQRRQTPTK
ncbi:MAG: MFS transporter [Lactobacillus sp.]|jgi:MFS family permease|nr:MFS transporter [Lactobacillus sp.]